MNRRRQPSLHPSRLWREASVTFCLLALAGCDNAPSTSVQGYIEGEYVYVACPFGGALKTLAVKRGDHVEAGDELFALDVDPERAVVLEAERRLAQAKSQLEDSHKGKRPSEIESLTAQLQQAETSLARAERDFNRESELGETAASDRELDSLRTFRDSERERVRQLQAELTTAALGARDDMVAAAEANVAAMEAALEKARWSLDQKRQTAPQAGLVFDTLYRQGEYVSPGRPVVTLLPPANIKARAFVPEPRLGAIQVGSTALVSVDGAPEQISGKVSYISPRAEFTPPVIYSRETRQKLVYMVEIEFEPNVAATLHPGQPVDVEFD